MDIGSNYANIRIVLTDHVRWLFGTTNKWQSLDLWNKYREKAHETTDSTFSEPSLSLSTVNFAIIALNYTSSSRNTTVWTPFRYVVERCNY